MENEVQRSISLRANSRTDRSFQQQQTKDPEGGFFSPERFSQDYPIKLVWKRGFIRLVLVGGITWMLLILSVLLFHVWSCQSSLTFLSVIFNKDSKVSDVLNNMGFGLKPPHRCPIPVADDPDKVAIPKRRSPDKIVKTFSYVMEDELANNGSQSSPLFGGHQSWSQRDDSFKLKSAMMRLVWELLNPDDS